MIVSHHSTQCFLTFINALCCSAFAIVLLFGLVVWKFGNLFCFLWSRFKIVFPFQTPRVAVKESSENCITYQPIVIISESPGLHPDNSTTPKCPAATITASMLRSRMNLPRPSMLRQTAQRMHQPLAVANPDRSPSQTNPLDRTTYNVFSSEKKR